MLGVLLSVVVLFSTCHKTDSATYQYYSGGTKTTATYTWAKATAATRPTTTTTTWPRRITVPPTRIDHHSFSGKTGHLEQWNHYPSYPSVEFYHIDNPNNDPIVIHFKTFIYTDSHNCTRESLTFYPRDWPYDENVLRFCGRSIPGNGHLYFDSLGAIESKREAYSSSTFSFDYETVVKNVALLPKSRLLEILKNMAQQNLALEGEANFAYNLLNDSHINNLAKRSVDTYDNLGAEEADNGGAKPLY